jgi:hypothetical protein
VKQTVRFCNTITQLLDFTLLSFEMPLQFSFPLPTAISASFTGSVLEGLMIASTFFTAPN